MRAEELGERTSLPQNPYRLRAATARVRQAEGDLDGALDLLDDAQRVYTGDFSPNVRPVPALRARVLADLGRVWMVVKGFKPSPITAERAHEADCVSTPIAAR
jgi:LuxR family maltose regulon positive regulatory protein